jgi:nucleoid-associated protein YgaU
MNALKSGQEEARKQLEAELKSKLDASDTASKEAAEALAEKLRALDETTFATMANLKDAIAEERKYTEGKLAAAVSGIEDKLADAAAETEKVAARVEAVNRAQEEFQAYVAKNYATKGELEALNLRVEGLEFVTKVMNADMVRANAEMKALISKEVADAKAELGDRIGKVEASRISWAAPSRTTSPRSQNSTSR